MSKTPFAPEILKHKKSHFSTLSSQFIQPSAKIVTVTFSTVHRRPHPDLKKRTFFWTFILLVIFILFLVMTP